MNRFKSLLALVGLATTAMVSTLVISTACSEREVYNVQDDDEILRYLRQVPSAQELFTTEGVFSDSPFYKSSDPGAEFRVLVDSVARHVTQYLTPDSVEKDHGSPFGLADDAEVRIDDEFSVRIQRVFGSDTTYEQESRYLTRWAYFLRIVDGGVYSGWVLHAANLSVTRGGTDIVGMDLHVQPENGTTIDADGFQYEYFTYLKYTYGRFYDPQGDSTYFGVDTSAGQSLVPYVLLSDIPEIKKGARLVISADNVSNTIPDASVRLRTTYLSESGWATSTADRVADDKYLDTIWLSDTTSLNFNVLWFYESRYPDRFGSFWGTAYRAVD